MIPVFVDIGFSNFVRKDKILSFLNYNSRPTKMLIRKVKRESIYKLYNCSAGSSIATVIIMENDNIFLSSLSTDKLVKRIQEYEKVKKRM